MVVGALGSGLNVLTLVAVMRNRDLTLYFRCALTSLVSTDLGLMATIFVASLCYHTPEAVTLTLIHLVYVFIDCTALTLLVIALDRASAVCFPAWHQAVSERRVKILLSVLTPWLLSVGSTTASFEKDMRDLPRFPVGLLTESGVLLQGGLLLACGLGVLLAYLAVGFGLTQRARRFVVHPAFVTSAATPSVPPAQGQRNRRITVHIAFLAVWFCIIYIPFSCYLLMLYLTDADRPAELNGARNITMSSFIIISSVVNPFLFFWRFVSFTSTFDFLRRVTRRWLPAQPQEDMEMRVRVPRISMDASQPDRGPAALSASRSTEDGTTAGRSLSEERRSRHATITTISSSVLLTSAVIYGERR